MTRLQKSGLSGNFGGYRFGFNGKEADSKKEWGSLTHYDYGFRIYNPSIARFLSVDPLAPSYPWYTPYQFAGNTPIQAIDMDGSEPKSAKRLAINEADHPTIVTTGMTWTFIHYQANGGKSVTTSHGIVYDVDMVWGPEELTYGHASNETWVRIGSSEDYYLLDEDGTYSPKTSLTLNQHLDDLTEAQGALNEISKKASDAVDYGTMASGARKADDLATLGAKNSDKIAFPFKTLVGKSLSWIKRQKPRGWKTVKKDNNKGWKWLDEDGNERLIYQRPSGENATNSQWSRMENGYFRRRNADGDYLDADGNIVPRSDPEFQWKTHIPYEGI